MQIKMKCGINKSYFCVLWKLNRENKKKLKKKKKNYLKKKLYLKKKTLF